MRFKIDENLPAEVAECLSKAGHPAVSVLDQQMGGRPDEDVGQVCREEGRVLVTLDLHFADIRSYPPADYAGLIVLRPASQDKFRVLELVERLIPRLEAEPLSQRLWVVDEGAIRIRGDIQA